MNWFIRDKFITVYIICFKNDIFGQGFVLADGDKVAFCHTDKLKALATLKKLKDEDDRNSREGWFIKKVDIKL